MRVDIEKTDDPLYPYLLRTDAGDVKLTEMEADNLYIRLYQEISKHSGENK